MNRLSYFCHVLGAALTVFAGAQIAGAADTNSVSGVDMNAVSGTDTNNLPQWLTRPLSLADALTTALEQNAAILEAQSDLKATHGLVIQTRAVALPQVVGSGQYEYTDSRYIENFPQVNQPNKNWNGAIQIQQAIYAGGKLITAIQAAEVTKRESIAVYRTAVENALLNVRVAYYDVLLAAQQVTVREASVKLLEKEYEDQQHRLDAGTVPKFNVLQAEVAWANERPNLILARNNFRIAKNNLANLLGYNLPRAVWQDIPFNLTDGFDTATNDTKLPDAIQEALSTRTELESARDDVQLQKYNVRTARSGYQPTISAFAGYDWDNAKFSQPIELDHTIKGWNYGLQMTWDIFDGALTYGKVESAKAQYKKSQTTLDDQSRQIELDVRTTYSDLIQAEETLDSQRTVQEEAEEALREANARLAAGTGTQLDVLNAETALTQARTTEVQAEHDYSTALARFRRATGADMEPLK